MPVEYLPVLIYVVLALAITSVVLFINRLLGPSKPLESKQMAYESGIRPQTSARTRFHVRYYLIAMIFLVFDLAMAFIYPWAVIYRRLGFSGFIEMLVFLGILVLGLVYAWRRGALRWE